MKRYSIPSEKRAPIQPIKKDDAWIPMADGTRLAAYIWLPDAAQSEPIPAILEYLPYRRRDGTAERDALTHPYFAGNGYAAIRVDMRGSGDSEGILLGEYLQQEQDDALEVITPLQSRWTLTTDVASGIHRHERNLDAGTYRIEDIDWEFGSNNRCTYNIHPDDPLSARCEIHSHTYYARGDWRVRIDTQVAMDVTRETFCIDASVDAFEGKVRVFARNWSRELPRDLV
jgi:hypothetical protein